MTCRLYDYASMVTTLTGELRKTGLRNIDPSEKSNSIPNSDGGRAGGVHSHAKSRG
jgi:hypothetical protein